MVKMPGQKMSWHCIRLYHWRFAWPWPIWPWGKITWPLTIENIIFKLIADLFWSQSQMAIQKLRERDIPSWSMSSCQYICNFTPHNLFRHHKVKNVEPNLSTLLYQYPQYSPVWNMAQFLLVKSAMKPGLRSSRSVLSITCTCHAYWLELNYACVLRPLGQRAWYIM